MSSRWATLLAGAAGALALAVAGCGGGDDGGAKSTAAAPAPAAPVTGAATTLKIKADAGGQLKYDKKTLRAKAGKVTIAMANPSQLTHSVAIDGNGVDVSGDVVAPGGKSVASATLKPGTYSFYCTVPGHRQAGMQGTLTVK